MSPIEHRFFIFVIINDVPLAVSPQHCSCQCLRIAPSICHMKIFPHIYLLTHEPVSGLCLSLDLCVCMCARVLVCVCVSMYTMQVVYMKLSDNFYVHPHTGGEGGLAHNLCATSTMHSLKEQLSLC